MQLLVCAATPLEIEPLTHFLHYEKITEVDVLITGVGMMSTAYALARSIARKRPDFILQAGVAGCLDPTLALTKVVLVEKESIGDLGVEEQGRFLSIFDLDLVPAHGGPWKNRKLANDLGALKTAGLTVVDGVTVNEISTDQKRINYYRDELQASVESMEGAALHFVALQENIPFLQMRSLSNFAGERNKSLWVMDHAIASLNRELERIIKKLLNK
jgi:futalosine hydrolase